MSYFPQHPTVRAVYAMSNPMLWKLFIYQCLLGKKDRPVRLHNKEPHVYKRRKK